MRAARLLRQGGLIAHGTGTLPGVAASPYSKTGLQRIQRFKQRRGPFLLLAPSLAGALALARFISPTLRRLARRCWPGPVTLIFPARPGLPAACYRKSELAVRVDASPAVRCLSKASGGLLLSSSLNRRGKTPAAPGTRYRLRHHRHLAGHISARGRGGSASKIIRIWRNDCTTIRQ